MACPNTHRASSLQLAVLFSLHLVAATQLSHCSYAQSTNGSIPGGGTVQAPPRCHQQQAAALLQLKRSFSFTAPRFRCHNFPATTTLSSWRADSDCCRWEGVSCDNVTGRVAELDLSCLGIQISGGLPPALFSLTSLQALKLDGINFCQSPLPVSGFDRLTQLQTLSLFYCNLTGPITLFNDGNILPSLKMVDLSDNSLSGTIPATIFTRPALQELYLGSNKLSGPIGEFRNPSAMLTSIALSNNQLTGAIPTSFSQLTALTGLYLDSNNFTGTLDLNPYFRLRNLQVLTASYNRLLSATADARRSNSSSYNNSSISILDLTSCSLTRIPGALRYLSGLDYLDLSDNRIGGRIPDWIWRNMTTLDLSQNKFTAVGPIPANTNITNLYLSFNKLRGAVPFPSFGDWLDCSNNEFSSVPPRKVLLRHQFIILANNKLRGPLPYAECNPNDRLGILDLSGNNFSGLIPPCLLKGCNGLMVLNLRDNRLSGTWPDELDKDCLLMLVDLHGNQLEGPLPRSLVNCKSLKFLDVGRNNFVDVFPTWLGNLPDLRLLVLRSNNFYGPVRIPLEKNHSATSYFPSVQIIDLAGNSFTGVIPLELFNSFKFMMRGQDHTFNASLLHAVAVEVVMKQQNMKMLKVFDDLALIDLSNNRFSGPIPKTVGNLAALLMLNMSHNAFSGGIPGELGRLARMESLDLSWNNLTGEIPRELLDLTALEWLNLSYNSLSGSIPWGRQFSTFPSSSFQGGNPGLYGCPLPVRCNLTQVLPPPPLQVPAGAPADHRFELIVFWLLVGSGYGLGFALAIALHAVCTSRRKEMPLQN